MIVFISCQNTANVSIENVHFTMTVLSPEKTGITFENKLEEIGRAHV